MGSGASASVNAAVGASSDAELKSALSTLGAADRAKLLALLSAKEKAKVFMMPPSQNACGPVLLAMDLDVGEPEFCDLMSGANKKPEFLAIHPYGQIPALKQGDFCLGESNAILRYLAMAFGQQYYPADTSPQTCGNIDFALDAFSSVYKAHMEVIYPVMGFGAAPADQAAANTAYTEAINKWLDVHVKDKKFTTGDFPSIADFKAVPFFYAAMQPAIKEKAGFEAPEKMTKYVNDFITAVGSCKFMQEAGGFAIREYVASKGSGGAPPAEPAPGSAPLQAPAAGAKWSQQAPAAKAKIYMMPPSQNACGPVLLATDLGVGEGEFCDLMSGAHKQPEHLAIHPYGQIPALKDGDFCLGESNAILRYLALAYGQKYYPTSSPQTCAKIDFALDAFSNVYKPHMQVVYPVFGFGSAPEDQAAANAAYTEALTKWLDTHVQDRKFVTGDSLSIADFKAAPFFYSAIQPAMQKKAGFEAPARVKKFCEDFMAATAASKFMEEAGGFSIKEFAASKEA